ncbi:MAG TPA: hypothetical protein VGK19_03795 [Capsulimonadaceae bacterium]|jgi:hypothetical protein
MGSFNILNARTACAVCRNVVDFEIQFKYGHTRQIGYNLGDKLVWNGNNVGEPGYENVLIAGIAGPCPSCATDYIYFLIEIAKDRIVSVVSVIDDPEEGLTGREMDDDPTLAMLAAPDFDGGGGERYKIEAVDDGFVVFVNAAASRRIAYDFYRLAISGPEGSDLSFFCDSTGDISYCELMVISDEAYSARSEIYSQGYRVIRDGLIGLGSRSDVIAATLGIQRWNRTRSRNRLKLLPYLWCERMPRTATK